jgi:filamentous hemagglutinin
MIKSRTVHVAVPIQTTPEQWLQINRAAEYAQTRNILLKVTETQ